jgi:hypothetical protein
MAFSGIGNFTIAARQSLRLTFFFPGGNGDRGPQNFFAHPINVNSTLVTTEQTKLQQRNGSFLYGCTVLNEGPLAAIFNVQGGGFT